MHKLSLMLTGAVIACAVVFSPHPAAAGFPFTAESYVDPCIVVCPAGDSIFTVIARRNGSWSGDPIWIDFCNCTGMHLAPLSGGEPYLVDSNNCLVMRDNLEPSGLAEFPLKAGGVCSAANIVISVFIPTNFVRTSVASPDQDGNLSVDAADLAIIQGKLGTSDPTADLNCDGVVNSADLAIANAHLGHHSEAATASSRATWGRLKMTYR